ncbi:MAG: 50S ribosomal protein L6 [Verrucomicrobiota bacterium]
MSRIGNKAIELPEKVSVNVSGDGHITVEGPKGKLEWDIPSAIKVEENEGTITVACGSSERVDRAMHGTARSLIANMVQGVGEGFVKELEIQGVGFRAAVKGSNLDLNLGFSHPLLHPIPEGIKVTVEENTNIKVEGIDKQLVGQFASDVRAYYPPEPYKGKGVRYKDEYVRRKAGKTVQ